VELIGSRTLDEGMETSMKKPKVLVVSYAFPPMAFPRSIQVSHLLKNLNASIVVICGEDHHQKLDPSIAPDIEKYFEHVFRVPFHRPILFSYIDYVGRKLYFPWSDRPDIYRKWNRRAYEKFLEWQVNSNYRPDILITFAQPMSDHLFGLEYKKRTGIPWIAHFSDPWVDNPYLPKNPFLGKLNQRMERRVIENADAIIFTSPETIDVVMRKYPETWRKKVFYLPHGYDQRLYDPTFNPPSHCYVIRSIGHFYGPRSPKLLFEAIEQIASESPQLLSDVVIELVGSLGRFKVHHYPNAQKIIHCIGKVPYIESLRLMQTAHCLLVIDAPAHFSVFFPSKLVEYIGTNRFIIAISPPGATSRVVKEVGGWIANPSEIQTVVEMLREVLVKRPEKLPLSITQYEKDIVSKEMIRIMGMTLCQKK
jgi:glycosyltransferase involved in cell wall biosynthesis